MKSYNWNGKKGFGVFLESEMWRVAYHAYDEEVNGLAAVGQWGIHIDSQETFTLLCGEGYLAVKGEDGAVEIAPLEPYHLYLVDKGERHILVLKEDTKILITENRNMENTVFVEATEDEVKQIKAYVGGNER